MAELLTCPCIERGSVMPDACPAAFPTTHWTMVHVAQGDDLRLAALALEDLCRRYWYPVYAYLRRAGYSSEDAEDLTQTTFQRLVTSEALQQVQQERGRLRSFLIGLVRQVISRHSRHHQAEKRGGGVSVISLDEILAGNRYAAEPADLDDPQRLFERAWAFQTMETVRGKLRASFIKTGRLAAYESLEPYLGWGDPPGSFSELGQRMNSNENAVRVLVHRLRKKFHELLEDEIALTVMDRSDIPAELEWMQSVLK